VAECTHGRLITVDACFGCDKAAKTPHKSDMEWVRPLDGKPAFQRCRECGQPAGHASHWTETGQPVDGPYTVTVGETDSVVSLDVTAFVTDLVTTLAQGALAADFCDLIDMYETASTHDGHDREQMLVERLVEALPTRLPLYPARAAALADEMRGLALRLMSARTGAA
jgi:hypothetical protein